MVRKWSKCTQKRCDPFAGNISLFIANIRFIWKVLPLNFKVWNMNHSDQHNVSKQWFVSHFILLMFSLLSQTLNLILRTSNQRSMWRAVDSLKFSLNVFRSIKPIFVWFSPCIGSPFKSWVFPGRNAILKPSVARGEARVGARSSRSLRLGPHLYLAGWEMGRPWLRFEAGQFAHLAAFKKLFSQFP
jgi:hypothetical protein